ncbi:FliH/SctL family protein [Acinetobacter sp. C26M]|uniref:FliH/SctL family protein n=1 Tax=unclassified Acinetobacter TaxID=196816 RepID=UPI0020369798|nr:MULTISPECIES: FliH/SctL family protein [unclassified Acinetobacter]USA45386.1 FliH/SctL family protein [Acinetobacter sp. C26M]USA48888.1 FliH/SctL family protein [Acinetobacter sp. C26G]
MSMKNKESSGLLRAIHKSADTVTLGYVSAENILSEQEQSSTLLNTDHVQENLSKESKKDSLIEKDVAYLREQYELEYKKSLEVEKLKLKRLHDQQLELLENRFKEKIDTLNNCITEFDRSLKKINTSIEKISIKVIDSILEKMVFSLSGHEQVIIELIKKAIYQHRLDQGFTLKVSLTDFDMIKRIVDENDVLNDYSVQVSKDSSLNVGQVLIELNSSIVDISFSQQINSVRQLLND